MRVIIITWGNVLLFILLYYVITEQADSFWFQDEEDILWLLQIAHKFLDSDFRNCWSSNAEFLECSRLLVDYNHMFASINLNIIFETVAFCERIGKTDDILILRATCGCSEIFLKRFIFWWIWRFFWLLIGCLYELL